jgi:hypothetical protein
MDVKEASEAYKEMGSKTIEIRSKMEEFSRMKGLHIFRRMFGPKKEQSWHCFRLSLFRRSFTT